MTENTELWRVIRFVTLPGNALARLDRKRNVLEVDKNTYNTLDENEQRKVLVTDEDLDYGPMSQFRHNQVA